MRQVNTMANKDAAGFDEMKAQVAELSKTIPLAREELAEGLYQTISNGVPEDNWLTFLEQSAKSSVGGLADLGETVKVTSTIIKNYGLDWDNALEIQDKIQMTAKNGVTSFEQLAMALPRVTSNAAVLGVSIDELMASFATLTGVSGNTAEVSTQIAAIFTALVKPSSEAGKMAEAMGIQFDAAAIKAAGGFQNFVKTLNESVRSYAASSGMLEQEIYGKLFGSAESLRALIPLTNQLASKYEENVEAMAGSTGTIDAAFAEMASTGEAARQVLRNQMAVFSDFASKAVGWAAPYVDMSAKVLYVAVNFTTLTTSIKKAVTSIGRVTTVSKLASAALRAFGVSESRVAAITRVFAGAAKNAAYQATALKIAIKGLMVATGVGVAVAALTSAIGFLMNRSEDATGSVEELSEEQEAYANSAANAKVAMDKEISSLKKLIDSHADTASEVNRLNAEYGNIFGSHRTAAEWYDTLTKKSEVYCRQLGYEAQARVLAQKAADLEIKRQMAADKMSDMERDGSAYTKETTISVQGSSQFGGGYTHTFKGGEETSAYKAVKDEAKSYEDQLGEVQKQIDVCTGKIKENAKALGSVTVTTNATVASTEKETKAVKDNRSELEKLAAERPKELKTLGDIDAELAYQRKLKETVALSDVANVNAEIKKLEELRAKYDETGKTIQKVKETVSAPGDISTLNAIGELDDAISYYTDLQKKSSEEEVYSIQKVVAALEKKREAYSRSSKITSMQDELGEFQGLGEKELKVKLEAVGFDTISDRLKELREMLDDMDHPVTVNQRKDIQEMIATYEQYQSVVARSFETYKSGWSSIKGVGDSISSMTSALEGNSDAWSKVTAIVDGFISLYEAIKGIVQVIDMMSAASAAHAAAKGVEAGSETAEAGTRAAASAANVAAATAETVANDAATASWTALAVAQTFAAHSSIPFVGVPTAAAYSATIQAAILAARIPKFAEGGIAYGPTIGLFGEYSGASANPEVVAPLDKLRSLMEVPDDNKEKERLTFRVKGRDLVAVSERYNKERRRG